MHHIEAIGMKRTLTPREVAIRDLVVSGLSSKEIAQCLSISPRTVDVHVDRVLKKYGLHSRIQLVRTILMGVQK